MSIVEFSSSKVCLDTSCVVSLYSSFKTSKPMEPVRLWPVNSPCWGARISICCEGKVEGSTTTGVGAGGKELEGGGGGGGRFESPLALVDLRFMAELVVTGGAFGWGDGAYCIAYGWCDAGGRPDIVGCVKFGSSRVNMTEFTAPGPSKPRSCPGFSSIA